MALQIKDRVWDTTSTTGTGTITLAGAPPNAYQSFGSVCSNNDTIYYTIVNRSANEWEVGLGTYNTTGVVFTLVRTTVLAGTAGAGNLTNFSAGIKDVFGDWPAKQLQPTDTLYHVKKYGAIGDGVADDTAAINSAIAAMNTAGVGVLYFPAGVYKVTSSLTSITARGAVRGDGGIGTASSGLPVTSQQTTAINYTSNNTACFTTAVVSLVFENLAIFYTGVSTPVAGSYGIITTMANVAQKIDLSRVLISGFNINLDIQGASWVISNSQFWAHIQYGIHISNSANHDAGDWLITGCHMGSDASGAITIWQDSSGGGKIVGNKFNAITAGTLQSDHFHIPAAGGTSDLLIVGNGFENFNGYGIYINTTSVNGWPNIIITGNQFATAFVVSATSAITVLNGSGVYIGNNQIAGGYTHPIDVTGVTGLVLGPNTGISAANQINGQGTITPGVNGSIDASGGIGGAQAITFSTASGNNILNWAAGSLFPQFGVTGGGATGASALTATNSSSTTCSVYAYGGGLGDNRANAGAIAAGNQLILISDNASGLQSGGPDPISFRAGGFGLAAEVFQAIPAGQLKFTNAANFSANGSVATALTSIGPTGAHTTVQTWLTIQGSTGNNLYIPCF